jgi:probable phosphoglycerate mutase
VRIVLVRHAQCEWQLARCGDLDSPLTPLGVRQAECLADWLASRPSEVGMLCSSAMRRARQTVDPVAQRLGLPTTTYDILGEADFPVSAELPSRDSPFAKAPDFLPSDRYLLWKRNAATALEQLVTWAQAAPGPLVVVSHGGMIKTLLRIVMNSDAVDFRLYNAALTTIEWSRGRWHFVHVNQMDHLRPELRTL